MSFGSAAFQLAYEISPIVLTGGSAQDIPGGMLPIVSLTEGANFLTGLLSGGDAFNLDDFFAHFSPMPGGTIIDQDIGRYSFANQAVAANAVITKPLVISMKMICPAKGNVGFAGKMATMTALQSTLSQHNVSGGTYTVVTPAATWTNLVMRAMRDITANASAQVQTEWQLDFEQPLLTQAQADQAQNNLLSKISGGVQTLKSAVGDLGWSSISNTIGIPSSLASSVVVPAATNLLGSGIAAPVQLITGGLGL